MKKLELKNLKVKKLSREQQSKIEGGKIAPQATAVSECNADSLWPIDCGQFDE